MERGKDLPQAAGAGRRRPQVRRRDRPCVRYSVECHAVHGVRAARERREHGRLGCAPGLPPVVARELAILLGELARETAPAIAVSLRRVDEQDRASRDLLHCLPDPLSHPRPREGRALGEERHRRDGRRSGRACCGAQGAACTWRQAERGSEQETGHGSHGVSEATARTMPFGARRRRPGGYAEAWNHAFAPSL